MDMDMQLQPNKKDSLGNGLMSSLKSTALSGHFLAMIFVRGFGVFLQLFLQLLLGRFFGPATLGIFQVFSSWMATLGEVSAKGQPTKSMKVLSVSGRSLMARAEFLKSLRSIIVFSGFAYVGLGLAYLFLKIVFGLDMFAPSESVLTQSAALLLIPSCTAFACLRLVSESMKALGRTVTGIFLDTVAMPLVVVAIVAALLVVGRNPSEMQLIVVATVTIIGIAVLSVALILQEFYRSSPAQTADQNSLAKVSSSETRAFWGVGVLSILFLSAPFIFMPFYAGMDEVGYFSVAFKLINLISTILILLASIYGPKFARAFHEGDTKKLRDGLKETQVISLALYVPFIVMLFVFCEDVLNIFGQEFVNSDSKLFLAVLALGQLVNAATGLPSVLLNMSGAAGREFRITIVSLLVFVSLTLILGQMYGGMGVALAFTAAMICKNCIAYIAVQDVLNKRNVADRNQSIFVRKEEYV